MATFAQLKELSENMPSIQKRSSLNYSIDEFAEHLPQYVRGANDVFVAFNKGVPGVLDYDESGFTEPEDKRDCYANNQALSRIDELIPYLEKINKHLPPNAPNTENYSMHVLHVADELLYAIDSGLSDEKIDYLCTKAIPKDYQFFGCKHYEYETCDARIRFQNGMSLEEVEKYQSMDSSLRQIVDFYTDWCKQAGVSADDRVIDLLVSSDNAGEAFGLYNEMCSHSDGDIFESTITYPQAKGIHDAISLLNDTAKNKAVNPSVILVWEDGTKTEIDRFSSDYDEGYVRSFSELIKSNKTVFMTVDKHPEILLDLTEDFIKNGGEERWISNYYEEDPERLDLILRAGLRREEKNMNMPIVEESKPDIVGLPKDYISRDGAEGVEYNVIEIPVSETVSKGGFVTVICDDDVVEMADKDHVNLNFSKGNVFSISARSSDSRPYPIDSIDYLVNCYREGPNRVPYFAKAKDRPFAKVYTDFSSDGVGIIRFTGDPNTKDQTVSPEVRDGQIVCKVKNDKGEYVLSEYPADEFQKNVIQRTEARKSVVKIKTEQDKQKERMELLQSELGDYDVPFDDGDEYDDEAVNGM